MHEKYRDKKMLGYEMIPKVTGNFTQNNKKTAEQTCRNIKKQLEPHPKATKNPEPPPVTFNNFSFFGTALTRRKFCAWMLRVRCFCGITNSYRNRMVRLPKSHVRRRISFCKKKKNSPLTYLVSSTVVFCNCFVLM